MNKSLYRKMKLKITVH